MESVTPNKSLSGRFAAKRHRKNTVVTHLQRNTEIVKTTSIPFSEISSMFKFEYCFSLKKLMTGADVTVLGWDYCAATRT